MVGTHYLIVLSGLAAVVLTQDPFYMCTESKCENCPSSITSTGTGYPDCAIYNSQDVFAHQGYNGTTGGGYGVYFDVQPHELGCATIIRSPASTDIKGCGIVIGAFEQPACALLNLETSFMVQSCCGAVCDSAGGKMIGGIGSRDTRRSVGRGGLLLQDSNGTLIEPAKVGPPASLVNEGDAKRQAGKSAAQRLQKSSCTKNSWKGGKVLTKPADKVQEVGNANGGPGLTAITGERTESWTTSMSLGVADIISLGVSTEFTKSASSAVQFSLSMPEGQIGKVGFTATLSCSNGTGYCDGDVEGEVCWPTMTGFDVTGTYHVIVNS